MISHWNLHRISGYRCQRSQVHDIDRSILGYRTKPLLGNTPLDTKENREEKERGEGNYVSLRTRVEIGVQSFRNFQYWSSIVNSKHGLDGSWCK